MKILFIGEYSNVHATLALGLRQLGHQVVVVSNGDFWKNYQRDIDVSRVPGKLGGILLMLKLYMLLPRLRDYDVVQIINPMFFEVKAHRLFAFYRYLRKHNRNLFLGGYGMDYYWVSECINNKPLRYSDFNIGNQLRKTVEALKEENDWIGTDKEKLNKYIADDCDGIITGLYEYWVCYHPHFPQKTTFIPYPIRIQEDTKPTFQIPPKIKVFIGISKGRSEYKGTHIMLKAAEDLQQKYPQQMEIRRAEGVPFEEYQHLMDGSDVILDQLYSYTPSMNSLLAMSKGIIVVGGGEPENYDIIHEKELRPIINVEPNYESVYHELEQLIMHPERIPELKKQSIEYVRKHHDYLKVAEQYLQFYQKHT